MNCLNSQLYLSNMVPIKTKDKPKSMSFYFSFSPFSLVVNPEQEASHSLIITQQKQSIITEGVYSFIYLYLINPSLFTEMDESRLKMNLLYTLSPVKGHSVQCSWCLQCIYTRYVTVWTSFRWPEPHEEVSCCIFMD